ncbi:MAG: glycosyltransferase family 4 protein, partial [Infirmifilum sp.]
RRALWTVWRPFVRKALAKADVVHVVSPVEAERILAHYPVEDKIVVVPNGVDEEVFQYKWAGQSSDYAIYAGRVERYKRLEEAAELVRRLGLWLVVVGKGPYRKRLEGRLRGVKFRDPLPRGEYLRTLAGARYAVNLSDMEAFSIFAAEALAMGVPVIASETVRKALRAEASQNLYGYPLLVKADVKTWDEVVEMYQSKLYGHITSRCSGASNSLNGLRDEDDSSKKIIF